MFDPLRKTEMKVGDIGHGRERRETYHCQVDEILSKLDEFIDVCGDAKKRSREYWHRPLSLEGVHDYALLLPPEQYWHQTAFKNKIYEKRFNSDNEFNIDEHDSCAGDSNGGRGEAVLTSADADMNQLHKRQRQTWRENREPIVRRHSRYPARGGSPAYSRDKTPSHLELAAHVARLTRATEKRKNPKSLRDALRTNPEVVPVMSFHTMNTSSELAHPAPMERSVGKTE